MEANAGISVNRKFKDGLFRFVFGQNKSNLLSLYNALNGTSYEREEDLTVTTLEDVIYVKHKNDISMLLEGTLNLYEHQSTFSPNMPLRGLFYFADLYRQMIPDGEVLYGSRLFKIPKPRYVVFYNGIDKRLEKDVVKLRLSDAFEEQEPAGKCKESELSGELDKAKPSDEIRGSEPLPVYNRHEQSEPTCDYEWTANVVDINKGRNEKLKDDCRTLKEYCMFVEEVRSGISAGQALYDAVSAAVDKCIEEGVLEEFLSRHRREVREMCLTEFNEEKYKEVIYKDGYEDGVEAGKAKGLELGEASGMAKGLELGEASGMAKGLELGEASGRFHTIFEIYRDGLLSSSDAAKKVSLTEDEFLAKFNEWLSTLNE